MFRPLAVDDLPRLAGWLNAPHVARWWKEPSDLPRVRERYEPRILGVEAVTCCVVLWDGQPVGMFQHCTWDSDPQLAMTIGAAPTDAGIDYLIGVEELTGRGLGAKMIAAFLEREVLINPLVTGVRVDVNAENIASRRTLEKLGFRLEPAAAFSDGGADYVTYVREG